MAYSFFNANGTLKGEEPRFMTSKDKLREVTNEMRNYHPELWSKIRKLKPNDSIKAFHEYFGEEFIDPSESFAGLIDIIMLKLITKRSS